jgi:nucleotide-binding universal stress UspA family protein
MLKKILLSLDGSENAEKALPWVKQYAVREHAQVILLRAVVTRDLTPDAAASEVQGAKEYLQGIERELNYAGIPAKMRLKKYAPVRAILDAAMAESCDLILMSTRGGSPVERWAIGGVTEQVLRLSPIPVLVIRSHTVLPRQGHVRRIIVPVDGSKLAEAAVSWSGRLAHLFKAKLVFVHVSPRGASARNPALRASYDLLQRRMKRACDVLAKEGVKASFIEQYGDPADRILQFADANDLILTTTHGAGGFKRWVFGSVAEKLIHAASIPVLVYKTAAQTRH